MLRTPGGLLEVSRIHATEMFDATIQHTIFGIKVGQTMPRIRVPAVYRYHIELEPEWRVVRADGVFTVVAPRIRPSVPVAVDFAGLEKDVAGSWMLLPFTSTEDLELLERSISKKLATKAASRDYLDRQREDEVRFVIDVVEDSILGPGRLLQEVVHLRGCTCLVAAPVGQAELRESLP